MLRRCMWEWMYRSCVLDLSTSWRWVVSFMPQQLYPYGKSPWYPLDRLGGPRNRSGKCVSAKLVPAFVAWSAQQILNGKCEQEKKILLCLNQCHPLGHPARSQSLYWLHYPGYFWSEYQSQLYLSVPRFSVQNFRDQQEGWQQKILYFLT
jgi:hypothetical protein